MKKVLFMPVLAALLFAAACGEDGGRTPVDPPPVGPTPAGTAASVRFFNATTGMTGSGGFTTNGQFASGSALAFGQSTQTCSKVEAGSTSFAFGAANTGGTGLSGSALATLANQTITNGGNYTVLAGGKAAHPSVVLLDNSFSGTLGTNQAAVRFVNLAAASQFPFTVLKGTVGSGPTTVVEADIKFRSATPFSTVTSGSNAYSIMNNNEAAISGNDATLHLQGGTVNTVVIVRNLSGKFQLINIPRC